MEAAAEAAEIKKTTLPPYGGVMEAKLFNARSLASSWIDRSAIGHSLSRSTAPHPSHRALRKKGHGHGRKGS